MTVLDMELPEVDSLLWKQNRLKTFKKWPFKNSDKCNMESMAAAGFYFVGNQDEPDLVECFICGKQLDGWESHDDPWTEHVKHKPNCFFVTLNKTDEKDWTVEELYKLYKKHQYNKYIQDSTAIILKLQDEAAALKNELYAMHKKNNVLKTGIVSQAKGSAYIEMGNTKVICSVFDPREVHNKTGYCVQGELYCEFKFAPFSHHKRKMYQQDAEEKEYSLILQRALEPAVCLQEFPNFQVDIYATVLDNGGSALAAAIMAASLALATAGVPMFGLVTASTIGIHDQTYLVDPTDIEEAFCCTKSIPGATYNHGIVVQAALAQHAQVSEMLVVGSVDIDAITHCTLNIFSETHKDICLLLEQCLVKTVLKTFQLNGKNRIDEK